MGQLQAHMGIALGDVDGDGLFDVFVTHLTEETHTLWKQEQAGLFRDATTEAGLTVRSSRSTGLVRYSATSTTTATRTLRMSAGVSPEKPRLPPRKARGSGIRTPSPT